jgi:hypothetical protein
MLGLYDIGFILGLGIRGGFYIILGNRKGFVRFAFKNFGNETILPKIQTYTHFT